MLKTALQRAWKLALIPTNPAKLVEPPKVKRARREEITVQHVRTLLAATADNPRLGHGFHHYDAPAGKPV